MVAYAERKGCRVPSQALEARVRMRYLPGNGTKAERATEIPKLPAERVA